LVPIAGLGGCEEEFHILPRPAIEPRSLGRPTNFAVFFISVNAVKCFEQLRAFMPLKLGKGVGKNSTFLVTAFMAFVAKPRATEIERRGLARAYFGPDEGSTQCIKLRSSFDIIDRLPLNFECPQNW
jgi:hypothetical protein